MHPVAPTVECRSTFTFHWLGACLRCLREAAERRVAFLLLFLSAGLVLVQPCGGASIGFENTGSLATARSNYTATLLLNGKVLIAGGITESNYGSIPLASAELYDPASGTWTATGSLVTSRSQHTATLLPNGKVLVVGGTSGLFFSSASAELYDPASGLWTTTGSLATARFNHTATLLPNGKVLVAGGFYGLLSMFGGFSVANVELYDPASGTWTATGSLATARVSTRRRCYLTARCSSQEVRAGP